jgi:hypothetical protein
LVFLGVFLCVWQVCASTIVIGRDELIKTKFKNLCICVVLRERKRERLLELMKFCVCVL